MTELSTQEAKLYAYMHAIGTGRAIAISDMHVHLYGYTMDNRMMQQRLGPVISRINTKAGDYEIVPGDVKRTYKIVVRKA